MCDRSQADKDQPEEKPEGMPYRALLALFKDRTDDMSDREAATSWQLDNKK